METRVIVAQTHGRYLIEGPPGAPMLVGFHGYMENAALHMAILRQIANGRPWRLVSVQGLHRFYNRAHTVVIANWMTSEDRELAIADNIAYVKAVMEEARSAESAQRPLVFAGFSQGVAMAYRAAAFVTPCDGLILLAGDVPPDVAPVAKSLPRTLLGRGSRDEWYDDAKTHKDLETLRAAGVITEEFIFDGGHEWHEAMIARAGHFLDEVEVR
jgi:predicted esterase